MSVHGSSGGQDLDSHFLTESGHDRKLLDKDWTNIVFFLLLDKDYTYIAQRHDKVWILCPMYVQPHLGREHWIPKTEQHDQYLLNDQLTFIFTFMQGPNYGAEEHQVQKEGRIVSNS